MLTNATFSRILCAVDHTEPGRAAFHQALSLAKAHGAVLSLVFAIPRSVRFNWRALERIRLIAEFRRIASAEGVSLSISAQQGDPAGIILLHARARKHDAIVMGMPDQSVLERFGFGSIVERVLAGAPCPTFVVRASENARVEDAFSHILCPVNVSPASESAVKSAMKLLRRGQKLTLLHVGPLQGMSTARRQLQLLALKGADLRGKIHSRLAGGPIASGILDVAAELNPDLIVLGMTSGRGVRRWFNSITARVVRGSTCAVLAIPGDGGFGKQHQYANT